MTPDLFTEFNKFANPDFAGPHDLERLMDAICAPARAPDDFAVDCAGCQRTVPFSETLDGYCGESAYMTD